MTDQYKFAALLSLFTESEIEAMLPEMERIAAAYAYPADSVAIELDANC